jgi:hypothetical protein
MNHIRGKPYNSRKGHGVYQNPRWPENLQAQSFLRGWGQMSQPRFPFLDTLNMIDLSKLMNEIMSHNPTCPPVPTELHLDIPKFEGKNGDDHGDHITTFHVWFSSNSINDNSIRLRLFQHTFIGLVVKWYTEIPRGAYGVFSQLVIIFLNQF